MLISTLCSPCLSLFLLCLYSLSPLSLTFLHSFRFLVRKGSILPKFADESFDWLSIEMVLVPEIDNISCPICLDVPCTPRFTRCGHIYCLPCLLQFFQTSEVSPDGLGSNWRTCPVCVEPLHLKQLRPVKFCPSTEPKENDIFNSVLIKKPIGSLYPCKPEFLNDNISSLSPFQRLIPISKTFVLDQILTPEITWLRNEIKNRKLFGDDSLEVSFYESSIKFLEDQRKILIIDLDHETESSHQHKHEQDSSFYYYHQSRDGLNVFLHHLCMKILKYNFETYDSIPSELSLPIIQLEKVIVNQSNRKRFKYLDHLSLGTQIILVEVDLKSIVPENILLLHEKELQLRKGARDQKLAYETCINPGSKDGSILDEWKRMEDDYYSNAQASSAMDIKLPETIKLDNLDDEASFPLPSSYNGNSNVGGLTRKKATTSYPSISSTTSGSPSFSALANSLNSPFVFSSSFSESATKLVWSDDPLPTMKKDTKKQSMNTDTNMTMMMTQTLPNKSSPSLWGSQNSPTHPINNNGNNNGNNNSSDTNITESGTSKKKIVLFSNSLNMKNNNKK